MRGGAQREHGGCVNAQLQVSAAAARFVKEREGLGLPDRAGVPRQAPPAQVAHHPLVLALVEVAHAGVAAAALAAAQQRQQEVGGGPVGRGRHERAAIDDGVQPLAHRQRQQRLPHLLALWCGGEGQGDTEA